MNMAALVFLTGILFCANLPFLRAAYGERVTVKAHWTCKAKVYFEWKIMPDGSARSLKSAPPDASIEIKLKSEGRLLTKHPLQSHSYTFSEDDYITVSGTGSFDVSEANTAHVNGISLDYDYKDGKAVRGLSVIFFTGIDNPDHLIIRKGDNDIWKFILSQESVTTDRDAREDNIRYSHRFGPSTAGSNVMGLAGDCLLGLQS